jgi:hypothetical protein
VSAARVTDVVCRAFEGAGEEEEETAVEDVVEAFPTGELTAGMPPTLMT